MCPFSVVRGRSREYSHLSNIEKVRMPQVLTIQYEVEIVEASQGQLKGRIDQMMEEKDP